MVDLIVLDEFNEPYFFTSQMVQLEKGKLLF